MRYIHLFILCLFIILPIASASLYPHIHSSAEQFAMFDPADIVNYNTVLSLDAPPGVNFPLIVYGVGALNSQKYYVSYSNNRVKFYTMIEGEMVERGNFDAAPVGATIYRIAATSRLSPRLIIAYYDPALDMSYVHEYRMEHSGAYVSGLELLKTYHTESGSALMPATNIDCDYYIDSGTLKYLCAYGASDNRIISLHSHNNDYTLKTTISDISIDVKHESINYIDDFVVSSIVASHGETYEVVVNDGANAVLFIDLDDCSSASCSLTSSSYIYIQRDKIASFTGFKWNPPNAELFMPDNGKGIVFFNKKFSSGNYRINISMYYDGVQLYNSLILFSGTSHTDYDLISYPMYITDVEDSGQIKICGGASMSRYNAASYEFLCIDPDTGSITTLKSQTDVSSGEPYIPLGVGRILNNQSMYMIYSTKGVMYAINKNGIATNLYNNFTIGAFPIFFADLDGNGYMESLQSLTGSNTFRYLYQASIPNIVVDDSLNYDGLYGFYNPGQVNTTQTIKARECDYISNNYCNYARSNGDSFARERLCTDCDGTISYTCGTYSNINPQVTCEFTSLGTYNVDVNMEFESHPNVTQHTFSITNWQITADANTANNLINVPNSPDIGINQTIPDDDTTDNGEPDGDDTYVTSLFAMIENNIASIAAIFIIIGVLSTLASYGIRDPIILLLAALLVVIIETIIGMLAIEFLIYIGLAIIALLMLSFILRPKS